MTVSKVEKARIAAEKAAADLAKAQEDEKKAAEAKAKSEAEKEAKAGIFSGGILTPKGMYAPQSNELLPELNKAAQSAGIQIYKVYINGKNTTAAELKKMPQHIDELAASITIAAVGTPLIEVKRNDKAGSN